MQRAFLNGRKTRIKILQEKKTGKNTWKGNSRKDIKMAFKTLKDIQLDPQ